MFLPRLARRAALACLLLASAPACAATVGRASFYGVESGRLTASGERFRPEGLTAAHRSLPFGTRLRVTDLATGRAIVVRVNDRGPAAWTGRTLDLAHGAARALGITARGTARVRMEIVS